MKLLIISHTDHYINEGGTIVGWGPTITEINHLTKIFDKIYHIAVLTDKNAPESAISYVNDTIKLVPLKEVGGSGLMDKVKVLAQLPEVIGLVNKYLKKVDIFQFRAPTGMGVYLIPYLTLFSSSPGWFKYAGNWVQEKPPLGFRIQRSMLKRQKRKVTINGEWKGQQKHCINFENPCLTEAHRKEGLDLVMQKTVPKKKVVYCFVGTFSKNKGIDKILEALAKLNSDKIGAFYFVGAGGMIDAYKKQASQIDLNIEFTGFLSKNEIHKIYAKCDYIILPSKNEGFPKVIGEAMNYGCIPIVSNVSCIGQYIKHKENGLLIEPNTEERLLELINESLNSTQNERRNWTLLNYEMSQKFTYDYYNEQIKTKILNIEK